jgi:hypothetical protein
MGRFSSARTCARPPGTGATRVPICYAMSPISSCAACLPVLAPPSM